MLREVAEEEARSVLRRAYQTYQGQPPKEVVNRLLESRGKTARHLAGLFFAWRVGADESPLPAWLTKNQAPNPTETVSDLFRAYANPTLNLADYGYPLSVDPHTLW